MLDIIFTYTLQLYPRANMYFTTAMLSALALTVVANVVHGDQDVENGAEPATVEPSTFVMVRRDPNNALSVLDAALSTFPAKVIDHTAIQIPARLTRKPPPPPPPKKTAPPPQPSTASLPAWMYGE